MGHQDIALEILGQIRSGRETAVFARNSARQGDILLCRQADPEAEINQTGQQAIRLHAGAHGEHWAIGQCELRMMNTLAVGAAGAFIVHTDRPCARHGAIVLAPGAWTIQVERELGLDESIQEVRD